ncbi:MAG: superoxide dismutase family protein [Planctomycetes bacterium]|nr:superoxide dismutase family protein [Planctomycetota bacterium]
MNTPSKWIASCSLLTVAFGASACAPDDASAASDLQAAAEHAPARAVCVLRPVGDSGVTGRIELTRSGDKLRLTGEVRGLKPGLHGFHVHQFGDLSDASSGKSAGGHFAPRGMDHGRQSDETRHVGDLGNIEANEEGVAKVDITDRLIALHGAHSVLGRAIVVHADADDYSQPTGAAGPRVAFGVIGVAK